MTDEPAPAVPAPLVPPIEAAPTTTAVADARADEKGEARSEAPPLTPPGTTETTFWQSHATGAAIVATVVVLNTLFLRPFVTAGFGDAGWMAVEVCEFAWLYAFGISRTDTGSLRLK